MPIYEYRCGACGFQKEYLQRMSDDPLTVCPECGKTEFNKMLTAAGFQLKGNGWYVTDFKNKGGGSGSKSAEAKKEEAKSAEPSCGTGACGACC